jgi:hypothetical protein
VAYVPFIGDGDIADACYRTWTIYGADLAPERIKAARERLPNAHLIVADCNRWIFPALDISVSLADFDAYGNPYLAFHAFWREAPKIFPLVCFFTDGLRLRVVKGDVVWDFGIMKARPSVHLNEARTQYNYWLRRYALVHIAKVIAPYTITETKSYIRRSMVYYGVVIR